MNTLISHFKILLMFAFSAVLLGCVGVSPKEIFYTLNTLNPETAAADVAKSSVIKSGLRIQIMPISINETVDRPQIVIKNTNNQVQYLEQQRWAQPLKYEIARVIGEQLHQQVNNSIVSAYPHQLSSANVQVFLQVIGFESFYNQPAKIKVNYTLLDTQTKKRVSRSHEYTQPLTVSAGENLDAIIEAHSLNLLRLSQDIAANINTL